MFYTEHKKNQVKHQSVFWKIYIPRKIINIFMSSYVFHLNRIQVYRVTIDGADLGRTLTAEMHNKRRNLDKTINKVYLVTPTHRKLLLHN